jgi:hypothetical protein
MGRSSLEWMCCFFIAVVRRGATPGAQLHISHAKDIFQDRLMTGFDRGFATADMLSMRTPLDSLAAVSSFAGLGHPRELHPGHYQTSDGSPAAASPKDRQRI